MWDEAKAMAPSRGDAGRSARAGELAMTSEWMIETTVVMALAFGCGTAVAQPCEEQWLESHGVAGPNGVVYAMTVWDDGRGPALYVGGSFSQIGDLPVNRIARWDGRSWEPLAAGMSGSVYALTTYRGQLIAGGRFERSGQMLLNGIASWDGSTWQPVAIGVSDGPLWTAVHSLTEYNSDLIVGGRFESAGGAPALNIARWDGRQWHAMGSGIEMVGPGDHPEVRALVAYDGDLLVGGRFDTAGGVASVSTASWNGREWSAVGSVGTLYTTVYDLAVFQGQPIAGSQVGLFAWNHDAGWTQYAGGVDDCTLVGYSCTDSVFALANLDEQLMVGGKFTTADGEIVNRIGAWMGRPGTSLGAA
jgi:trimeric autotransporter adhesin